MHRRRLILALLTSLLFAQLLWAGSGFACGMPGAEHSAGVLMAGMDMSGDMAGMDMSGMATPEEGGVPAHHHTSCDTPAMPDDCQSMAPCAPLALASAPESSSVPQRTPSFVTPLVVLTPPSLAFPPESPPPRA
jgi:hypothetical protein